MYNLVIAQHHPTLLYNNYLSNFMLILQLQISHFSNYLDPTLDMFPLIVDDNRNARNTSYENRNMTSLVFCC